MARFLGIQGSIAYDVLRALGRRPGRLLGMILLSLSAFLVQELASYFVAMAFTGPHVILHVDRTIILMGLVGGYVARLVPLTPGGIGQFEWGFAAALYIGGVGAPEAATIAVLVNLVRYASGTGVLGVVTLGYGIETNLRRVLDLFRGTEPEPAAIAS